MNEKKPNVSIKAHYHIFIFSKLEASTTLEATSLKRKRGERDKRAYNRRSIYSTFLEAQTVVRQEETWARQRIRTTNDGEKECYNCREDNCDNKLYILLHTFDATVSVWKNYTAESKATTHFAIRCRCHSICAMPLGWSGTGRWTEGRQRNSSRRLLRSLVRRGSWRNNAFLHSQ